MGGCNNMLNPNIPKQSLWPGITRKGGGLKSHVRIKPGDIGRFPQTTPISGDGINVGSRWLPLLQTSEIGLRDAQEKYKRQRSASMGKVAALSSMLTPEGCWVSSELQAGTPEHVAALWEVVELDIEHPVLDLPTEIEDIHVCDDPGCLNPRHYNFIAQLDQRQQKSYPEYAHFKTDDETGIVIPDWYVRTGEYLPPVEESVEAFLGMRALCAPYTDGRDAPLSDNGVSKIAIDPITGCWVAQSYYLKPPGYKLGFQYDGYARFGVGKGLQKRGMKSQQITVHRLMAVQYGIIDAADCIGDDEGDDGGDKVRVRVQVNHRCGTRNCCYPGHLEQATHSTNVLHSYEMRRERQRIAHAKQQPPLIP